MRIPEIEIERGNIWYTSDQFISAQVYALTIQRRRQFIASVIKRERGRKSGEREIRVLDTACGDGVLIEIFNSETGVKVWALDYNLLRLKRAKSRFPQVHFSLQDLTQIALRESQFDVIILSQAIEHIREDEKVLRNLFNLLVDGGILVLGTPNEGCFLAQLRNNLLEPSVRRTTDHVHFYTEKRIKEKIEKVGFVVQEVIREGFFFPLSRASYLSGSRSFLFNLMNYLGKLFASQVAGFYFVCRKRPRFTE